jgi:hypothetical protein
MAKSNSHQKKSVPVGRQGDADGDTADVTGVRKTEVKHLQSRTY